MTFSSYILKSSSNINDLLVDNRRTKTNRQALKKFFVSGLMIPFNVIIQKSSILVQSSKTRLMAVNNVSKKIFYKIQIVINKKNGKRIFIIWVLVITVIQSVLAPMSAEASQNSGADAFNSKPLISRPNQGSKPTNSGVFGSGSGSGSPSDDPNSNSDATTQNNAKQDQIINRQAFYQPPSSSNKMTKQEKKEQKKKEIQEEAERRYKKLMASEIGRRIDCTFERFIALATENYELLSKGINEAEIALKWEAMSNGEAYVMRPHPMIQHDMKVDFVCQGTGKYKDITHIEVKGGFCVELNPSSFYNDKKGPVSVDSYQEMVESTLADIKDQQGRNIGKEGGPEDKKNLLTVYDLDFLPAEAAKELNILQKINDANINNLEIINSEGNPDVIWTHKRSSSKNENEEL